MFRSKVGNMISIRNFYRTASVFLAFAILCNLCYLPCYLYIRNMYRERVVAQHEYTLMHGMQLLDSSVEAISTAANIYNRDIRELAVAHSRDEIEDIQLKSIQKTFSSYFLPYDFIAEIGVTNKENLLFSRYRIYYTREYLSYPYYWQSERETYLSEFSGVYCLLPPANFNTIDYGQYNALTIGYRLSNTESLYLFVHYPCDLLYELFAAEESLQNCPILLYHGDTLLASSMPILERNFELLSIESNNGLGLRIEIQLPHSYIERDLSPLRHLVAVFLSVVFVACVLWIALFSYIISRPFARITNAVLSFGHLPREPKHPNPTEFLVQSIQVLGNTITSSTDLLNAMQERNRIHILERALNRGLFSDEAKADFEAAFPEFPAKWQLARIQFSSDSEDIKADTIQASLAQYFEERLPTTLHFPFTHNSMLALFSRDTGDSPKQVLDDLCSFYQQRFPIYMSYTLGRVYSNPLFLADASQEIEYTALLAQQDSGSPASRSFPVSMQRLHTMYNALQARDEKAALTILSICTAPIISNSDYISAKYAYRAVSYVLIQLKDEHACLQELVIPTFRRDKIKELFLSELPFAFRQVVELLEQNLSMQIQNLDEHILAFINENIGNQQLSVTSVTDHFNISAPTLQKRLTSSVGKTFSAYVEGMRMKKARQSLLESDLSVQDIAEHSGYTNTNSFYKAYKRFYGESPRDTRKKQDIW